MDTGQQEQWGDVIPFTGPPEGRQLPPEGKTLVKIEAPYQTAIMVQKPRDIDKVQKAVLRESEYAGGDFFYSWTVKSKKGPQTIQGPSIGLAMCVAREWGNCAVDVKVEPAGTYDLFTAAFIDIERGFTAKRAFKQQRTVAPGRYDADRWEDMEFQKAQSKAIRNVIVSGVPRWLVNQAIAKAKDAELNKISKEGIEVATQKAIDFLGNYGVSEERILMKLGKARNEIASDDILVLRGYASELKDGQASANELFPPIEEAKPKEEAKPETEPATTLYDEAKNLRKPGYANFIHRNIDRVKKAPEEDQKKLHAKWIEFYTEPWPLDAKTDTSSLKEDDDSEWNGLHHDCPDMDGNPIAKAKCNPNNPQHCPKLEGCPKPFRPGESLK